MPFVDAPLLLPPVTPVRVVRAYRSAAPFRAGARRSVRLAARHGGPVIAPCGGRVAFVGTVAGSATLLTLACDQALLLTLSGVRPAIGRGELIVAGRPLGRAVGSSVGFSARDSERAYVDPIPLLRGSSRPPVPPGARRRPRPPALPRVELTRAVRTLSREPVPMRAGPAPADAWLGGVGTAVGVLALATMAAGRRRRNVRALRRASGSVVHHVASRR